MNLTTLTLAGSVYKHPTKKPKREIVDTWTSHLLTLTNSCSSNSYWRTWTRNSWWFEDCCHFLRKCWSWGTVHISPSQYSFRTLYLYLYLPNCVVLMSITNPYNYIQSCLLEITLIYNKFATSNSFWGKRLRIIVDQIMLSMNVMRKCC